MKYVRLIVVNPRTGKGKYVRSIGVNGGSWRRVIAEASRRKYVRSIGNRVDRGPEVCPVDR
jgi:hypothetical protein